MAAVESGPVAGSTVGAGPASRISRACGLPPIWPSLTTLWYLERPSQGLILNCTGWPKEEIFSCS